MIEQTIQPQPPPDISSSLAPLTISKSPNKGQVISKPLLPQLDTEEVRDVSEHEIRWKGQGTIWGEVGDGELNNRFKQNT